MFQMLYMIGLFIIRINFVLGESCAGA